jgi:hypothetical protein
VVLAFIQQRAEYLVECVITKSVGMKDVNYPLTFIGLKRQRRRWASFNRIDRPGFSALMPVKGCPWN